MSLPPLLLVEPSPGCSHKFVDSAVCLHCGEHCSDLHLADLGPDGIAVSVERARQVLRFVARFGEPLPDAGRARLVQLRELVGGAS